MFGALYPSKSGVGLRTYTKTLRETYRDKSVKVGHSDFIHAKASIFKASSQSSVESTLGIVVFLVS